MQSKTTKTIIYSTQAGAISKALAKEKNISLSTACREVFKNYVVLKLDGNKFANIESFCATVNKKRPGKGRPKTNFKKINSTSELGTKEGETRATFIVSNKALENLKALAYWKRVSIKNVVGDALDQLFKDEKTEMEKAFKAYAKKGTICSECNRGF